MDLPTIWFVIVGYLFAGFFLLEGFDYGVAMLLPLFSRDDEHRRMLLLSIGGVWDGNEVWMITAGAVLFAAFPVWYATLFSALYLAFVLMLVGLIARGVGIKFRNHRDSRRWRQSWDSAIALGSFMAAFLWGMGVGSLLTGIPINRDMVFVGSLLDLVSPFTLITASALVLLFLLHGLVYLNIRLSGEILNKLQAWRLPVYLSALVMAVAFLGTGYFRIGLLKSLPELMLGAGAALTLIGCGFALWKKAGLLAFGLNGLTIVLVTALVFTHLYPYVLISSLDPRWSLTVHNASSSPYALRVMSVVALVFIPAVAVYQGWTYWVLRKRIERADVHY